MTTKPIAYITVGVSGSGKTTWANEQEGYQILCRDDIRHFLTLHKTNHKSLNENLWKHYKWKWEKEVSQIYDETLDELIADRENIILADTNLNPKYRLPLIAKLKAAGYEIYTKAFDITFEEAVKRDLYRLNSVGKDVIYKQWLQWKQYMVEVKPEPIEGLPNAIICDIDGTLAHMNGKRGPFEWDKVGLDKVDRDVAFIIAQYRRILDAKVILLSGRDSVCRNLTEDWLTDNHIWYNELHMRPQGDTRKDTEVKREMFDEHIRNKYNVLAVFDDRPCVVRMWLDMGLKVFACGNPYLEF